MLKVVKRIRTLAKELKVYRGILSGGGKELQLVAIPADNDDHVLSAQRLHASVYLARGFVQSDEVGDDGRLTLSADPHQRHAEYFVVVNNEDRTSVRAVARMIRADREKGFDSFPILAMSHIYKRDREEIMQYSPQQCVEISALSKTLGESSLAPLLLYREMLYESLRRGDKLWLMACDVRLYRRLKLLFGSAIKQIGEVTSYYGGDVVPSKLSVEEVLPSMLGAIKRSSLLHRGLRRSAVRFMTEFYPKGKISKHENEQLEKLRA